VDITGKNKPVIGLVGGVCAGKSTAAAEFAALGCAVIDADAIGYELLASPEVKELILARWGRRVITAAGEVDREVLGGIVFADRAELEALNEIMHDRMRGRIEARIAEAMGDPQIPAIVLDAAVMFEAGWDDMCTVVLFVSAPEQARRRRAAQRGWGEGTWQRRENSQISLDTKAADCYCELDNSSTVSRLRDQVHRVFRRIAARQGQP